MKTVGIIGGIGPESTVEYYQYIIAGYREQRNSYPSIVINSVDLQRLVDWLNAGEMDQFTDYLVNEVQRLERAGVDFGVLAANTPHIVFDQIRSRTSLPLISIVESARDKVRALGLKRPGLFGTGFTMRATFYSDTFATAGLPIITPSEEEKTAIHEIYFGELLKSVFLPESRARLLEIVDRMRKRDSIDGLILAGTELPLLLRASDHNGIPLLDTTKIHVQRIVEQLLS
jgi:aspartate racemase